MLPDNCNVLGEPLLEGRLFWKCFLEKFWFL
jgi:hypothetical protein